MSIQHYLLAILSFWAALSGCSHGKIGRNITSAGPYELIEDTSPIRTFLHPSPRQDSSAPNNLNTQDFEKPTFVWPIQNPNISSAFGERWGRLHEGIDISAPLRTSVQASYPGKVIYASRKIGAYGNMVIIQHENELNTVYAHNTQNLVKPGDYVQQGQAIATLGNTGHTTGPHLHFEIRKGIEAVNPLDFLPPTP